MPKSGPGKPVLQQDRINLDEAVFEISKSLEGKIYEYV